MIYFCTNCRALQLTFNRTQCTENGKRLCRDCLSNNHTHVATQARAAKIRFAQTGDTDNKGNRQPLNAAQRNIKRQKQHPSEETSQLEKNKLALEKERLRLYQKKRQTQQAAQQTLTIKRVTVDYDVISDLLPKTPDVISSQPATTSAPKKKVEQPVKLELLPMDEPEQIMRRKAFHKPVNRSFR